MNAKIALPLILIASFALAACAPAAPTSVPGPVSTSLVMATQVASGAMSAPPAAGLMVIKDAQLVLAVQDVGQAVTLATQLAADHGGYVQSARTWQSASQQYAEMRLMVAASQFEPALNRLRQSSERVIQETTSGQEVSAEYSDLQSQLTNLEATAARVRSFLQDAENVEEALRVNGELSRLESQIDRIKGQMLYYEGRTAFSTISLTINPAVPPAAPERGWNPLATLRDAWRVLTDLAQFMGDLFIWITIVLLPLVVMIGIPLAALAAVRRRWARSQKARQGKGLGDLL